MQIWDSPLDKAKNTSPLKIFFLIVATFADRWGWFYRSFQHVDFLLISIFFFFPGIIVQVLATPRKQKEIILQALKSFPANGRYLDEKVI